MRFRSSWPSSSRPGDSLPSAQRPREPMSGYAKRLHGKDRLHRIVRIRTLTLGSLGGVTALFILAGFAAQGASLKPLFLPLAGAIEIGLLMAVVAAALAAYRPPP